MKANKLFLNQPKPFWANVRSVSQHLGYTLRGKKQIKIPTMDEMSSTMEALGLTSNHLIYNDENTEFGNLLIDYFKHRADVLNNFVESKLMNVEKARQTFEQLKLQYNPNCPIPMNKQKGEKQAPSYFTGIINILIEANSQGFNCNYDPRELTSLTSKGVPIRTLARRVDGAFTSTINPIAIWEIKEYYYTTTFGSRVADGVYETLLDGLELEEVREHENIDVKHYLMIDDHNTWWNMGRSYLCRMIDMLHMGYVDEVLFGYEVVDRLPEIVKEWVIAAKERKRQ